MVGPASGYRKSRHYRDVKGVKVSSGELVNTGTILTRQGDKWKPGKNVGGRSHLYALCRGKVYFSKKRGKKKKVVTYINILAVKEGKKE